MSLFETIGAVVGIIYLILEYRANRWLWLFGALMPLFYIYIFFKQQLYANAAINVYYLGASVYGAVCWAKAARNTEQSSSELTPTRMPSHMWWMLAVVAILLTLLITLLLHQLGESSEALIDGLTTALSIVGMWMMAKRYYQQWICWMVVEPLMVLLSIRTGMYPTAIMYLVYCVIVWLGYRRWKNLYEQSQPTQGLSS